MTPNICIVSPDLVGPVKNGGIGTACFHLAKVLAKNSYNVSLLFTGPLQNENHDHWQSYYKTLGIEYFYIDDVHQKVKINGASDFQRKSFSVYKFLKSKSFDFIHFQDWQANALVSLQAKETTEEFNNTVITVTMHSSTQWQQEGMKVFNHMPPIEDSKQKWAEEYCVRNCDVLISPSKHMFKWANESNWLMSKNQKVIPYCFCEKTNTSFYGVDSKHLIFFGRLETRKGLEYFIDNVLEMENKIEKISFLGKVGTVSNQNSSKYISDKLADKIDFKILSHFDTFESIDYIKRTQGLVVIPSLLDNFPYTVIESIQNNIPFICSNAGGIPEMVDPQIIFDINQKYGLLNLLKKINTGFFYKLNHVYDAYDSNSQWMSLHDTKIRLSNNSQYKTEPKISICIPYYNYPKYLPLLLKSISNLNYKNFEVIIVNDGSPDKDAEEVFFEMKKKYKDFKFYCKENSGVGDTRNFAASKAHGEYLVFMDSDNLADPAMLKHFSIAIQKSNADCITCYFNAFDQDYNDICPQRTKYKYMPLGDAIEIGLLENVFGDANFIVKKSVFDKIGGFGTERSTSWEDWEFLAKLNLEGYKQSVIPKSLFWYRHTDEGFSRITNLHDNRKRILKLYSKFYPTEIRKLFSNILLPFYTQKDIKFTEKLQQNCDQKRFLKKILKRE